MEFQREPGRIFAQDDQGRLLAELTYAVADGVANIDHTFVDDSLRGQGVAGQLMETAVQELCAAGLKANATCTYAVRWFSEHPEQAELL